MIGDRGEQRDVKEAARWKGYNANEQQEGCPGRCPGFCTDGWILTS